MEHSASHVKRCNRRHPLNIEARVSMGERSNSVNLTNLSETGLQLECNRQVLDELMPNIQRPDPRQPIQINVEFRLPDARELTTSSAPGNCIRAACHMLYVRRLAQDRFLSGGEFIELSSGDKTRLTNYLAALPRA